MVVLLVHVVIPVLIILVLLLMLLVLMLLVLMLLVRHSRSATPPTALGRGRRRVGGSVDLHKGIMMIIADSDSDSTYVIKRGHT